LSRGVVSAGGQGNRFRDGNGKGLGFEKGVCVEHSYRRLAFGLIALELHWDWDSVVFRWIYPGHCMALLGVWIVLNICPEDLIDLPDMAYDMNK
jgi:hypothetical protein